VLQQAHFSNFKVIRYNSKIEGNSFIIPAKAFLDEEKTFLKSLIYDSVDVPVVSSTSSSQGDVIVYEFNRFRLVPYAIFIWLVTLLLTIPQTRFLKNKLSEQFLKDIEFEKKSSKAEIAKQVRHNLRTPLAALMRIPQKLPSNAVNEKNLLEITINQIQGLIQQLDIEDHTAISKNAETSIFDTLIASRQELKLTIPKRIDLKFEIQDSMSANQVVHIPSELRSILANMVNNSIEAIDGTGKIVIQVYDKGNNIEIRLADDGVGIPYQVQSKIFEKSFSYNKKNGSGIGLSHAKDFINQWGGEVRVESSEGLGATFIIRLPIKNKEPWYLPRIKIHEKAKIFVLDDQQSALELWKQKLGDSQLLDRSSFYSGAGELLAANGFDENSIFLIDYDLGADLNGIDVLSKLPKQSLRCLVTGHFDDCQVRAACSMKELYLIPKSQIEQLVLVG
jgi:signal transduction histidine kinase